MDIRRLPSGVGSIPSPAWKCCCCGDGFVWTSLYGPYNEIVSAGPFTINIDSRSYWACSAECARNMYLVKGLELIFAKAAQNK